LATSTVRVHGVIKRALNSFSFVCRDYPDFYQKLYALLEPTVFHVKYRARFFYLLDLFLTST